MRRGAGGRGEGAERGGGMGGPSTHDHTPIRPTATAPSHTGVATSGVGSAPPSSALEPAVATEAMVVGGLDGTAPSLSAVRDDASTTHRLSARARSEAASATSEQEWQYSSDG